MGNTQRVVDGEENQTIPPLRPAAPDGGASCGSGVTAGRRPRPAPRPRRPWLQPPTDPDPELTRVDPTGPATGSHAPARPDADADTDTDTDAANENEPSSPSEPTDPANTNEPQSSSEPTEPAQAASTRRRRTPFAHALRVSPTRLTVGAARSIRRWSRRPSGQLTLPGVSLLLLVAATVTAGALLLPAVVPSGPNNAAATADASDPAPDGLPSAGALPPSDATLTAPPPNLGRPADTLTSWAAQTGAKVDIAPVALQAYGYAELVLAQTNPSCGLSWTTLAAIGHVESAHGQANNARLGTDGRAAPEIIGLPLDGQGGRMLIRDTDHGTLDQDATYDRAIGPMQFIPTTWEEIGADADNDGRKDPHDIDDAALAAGNYLCKGGRNLTIATDWWNSILSYNNVRQYAQDVFDKANQYGQASRS